MHKVRNQIKKAAFALVAMLTFGHVLVFGQVQTDRPKLLDIQQAYQRGEIDVERAVKEQFRMIFEPSDEKVGHRSFEKCLTPAFMFLHRHRDEISEQTRNKIEEYETQKVMSSTMLAEENYISPSGKFEIIYYTSGEDSVSLEDNDSNGIPDYVEYVAESADSSYQHMINTIGYSDPIPDGMQYRVYIENASGAYGFTSTSSSAPGGTYVVVNNNFDGFPPNTHPEGNTVGAIYATVAHEFKHSIQYIQNNWSGENDRWAEMDATLMEEVVYDDVNDYYNYIDNFSSDLFSRPSTSLIPGSYEDITWALYFEEYIGPDFWVEVWERIEAQPSIEFLAAVEDELNTRGYDFDEEVVRSYLWHFASGSRAGNDDYGFEEKMFYPDANTDASFLSVPPEEVSISDIRPMSSRFFEISPSQNDLGRIDAAIDFDSTQIGLGLIFYMKNGETREQIATGTGKGQVYVPSDIDWEDVNKLGIIATNYSSDISSSELKLQFGKTGNPVNIKDPIYVDLPNAIKVYQNYPNPFNPVTNISFEIPRPSFVTLEVFDVMGRKVQTLVNRYFDVQAGAHVVPFNASSLSSGVYIYRLRIDDMVFTKKMTLVK